MSQRPHSWIRSPDDLQAAIPCLRAGAMIALDSESDSLHHHVEKVCLVQLAAESGEVFLLDPLAFRDLSALAPLIADPGLVKVLHGADYDVTTLKRDFGFTFAGLFDTMIAARFLGRAEIGLQALAAHELGVTLDKGSQRDDWSRRPLTPLQETYAAADVRHLFVLRARLMAELEKLGRLSWVLEECAVVAGLPAAERRRDADAFLRVKGAARLAPRLQAIVRELHSWRETLAEESDVPAFKLLGNETLLALGQTPPKELADLRTVRGLSPRVRAKSDELLAVVRRAQALPPEAWPVPKRPERSVLPPEVQKRIERLRTWRATEAQRLGVELAVVLPQRLIDRLAEAAPRSLDDLRQVEGLRTWRVEALGQELLRHTN
jgi:ribonuclease D